MYNFIWDSPAELYNSIVIDYTVTCDPNLEGVMDRQATTTATSVGLELGPGLSYFCRVSTARKSESSVPALLLDPIHTLESGV